MCMPYVCTVVSMCATHMPHECILCVNMGVPCVCVNMCVVCECVCSVFECL